MALKYGLLGCLCVAVLAHAGGETEKASSAWRSTAQFLVADVLPQDDGSVKVLYTNSAIFTLSRDLTKRVPLAYPKDEDWGLLRIFPDKARDNGLLFVGRSSNAILIWSNQGGPWTQIASIPERPDNLRFHQSRDGVLWFHSWEGVIFRVEGGQVEKFEPAPRVDRSQGSVQYYRPFEVTESAGGAVCFFQQFGYSNEGRSIGKILVHASGGWKEILFPDHHPGGACFLSEEKLLVATEKGLVEIDLAQDGKQTVVTPPPTGDFPCERPIFMERLPDGNVITLWSRKTHSSWTGVPSQDGVFSRFAEWKDGAWRLVPGAADLAAMDMFRTTRPSVVDSQGGLWLGTADRGLLYRSPGGEWRTIHWENGCHMERATRLAIDASDRIWSIDQNGFAEAVDMAQLLRPVEASRVWSMEMSRGALKRRPDGSLYGLTDEKGGCLVTFGPEGKVYTDPLPEKYRSESVFYHAADSDGGVWVFGDITQKSVAYYDGKAWQLFTRDSNQGMPFHEKEIAFQTLLGRGAQFRIGTPEDTYHPIFTADGRILYKNEWGRVCYFDGKVWHAPYGGYEVGRSTLRDHPFFHDGKVTIYVGATCYQMENDAWSNEVDGRGPRPWKEVAPIPNPFSRKRNQDEPTPAVEGCLIPSEERRWTRSGGGWTWVGAAERMACSPGGSWMEIPLLHTPLAFRRRVEEILQDPHGRWFFRLEGTRPFRYVVYQSEKIDAVATVQDLGRIERPLTELAPAWRADRPDAELMMSYRFGEGEWSKLHPIGKILSGAELAKGRHTLQVRLSGKNELFRAPTLTYGFEVAYDIGETIQHLITQLGAGDFADRVKAEQGLIRLGPAVVPEVEKVLASSDPEVRFRAGNILRALAAANP
jgi:hypothetical protein